MRRYWGGRGWETIRWDGTIGGSYNGRVRKGGGGDGEKELILFVFVGSHFSSTLDCFSCYIIAHMSFFTLVNCSLHSNFVCYVYFLKYYK